MLRLRSAACEVVFGEVMDELLAAEHQAHRVDDGTLAGAVRADECHLIWQDKSTVRDAPETMDIESQNSHTSISTRTVMILDSSSFTVVFGK